MRLDLHHELARGAEHVLSPSVHCTWTDEDFIGRVSRLSRRGHGRVLPNTVNSIKRALGFYKRIWEGWFGDA